MNLSISSIINIININIIITGIIMNNSSIIELKINKIVISSSNNIITSIGTNNIKYSYKRTRQFLQ